MREFEGVLHLGGIVGKALHVDNQDPRKHFDTSADGCFRLTLARGAAVFVVGIEAGVFEELLEAVLQSDGLLLVLAYFRAFVNKIGVSLYRLRTTPVFIRIGHSNLEVLH